MSEELPFFVYGTLQEGFGNWANHLEGKTTAVPATIEGFDCYHFTGFPGIFPSLDEKKHKTQVKGELHTIAPPSCENVSSFYKQVLRGLDWLEDYNVDDVGSSMYRRVKHEVVLEGNKRVVAWVYICQIDVNEGKKLKDDVADWKLYMREGGYRDEVDPFRPSSSCSSSSSSSGDE